MPRGRQGQAVEPTKSARLDQLPAVPARVPGWLVGACGWGSGMPAPPGQIPPPWAWWENEAPATRAARDPLQADSVGAIALRLVGRVGAAPGWRSGARA